MKEYEVEKKIELIYLVKANSKEEADEIQPPRNGS